MLADQTAYCAIMKTSPAVANANHQSYDRIAMDSRHALDRPDAVAFCKRGNYLLFLFSAQLVPVTIMLERSRHIKHKKGLASIPVRPKCDGNDFI